MVDMPTWCTLLIAWVYFTSIAVILTFLAGYIFDEYVTNSNYIVVVFTSTSLVCLLHVIEICCRTDTYTEEAVIEESDFVSDTTLMCSNDVNIYVCDNGCTQPI